MSPFELASFIRFIYSNSSFVSIQFLPIKLLNHDTMTSFVCPIRIRQNIRECPSMTVRRSFHPLPP